MRITPREEVARAWREHDVAKVRAERKKRSKVKNLGFALRLEDGRELAFRGRAYTVPPIPWDAALSLLQIEESYQNISQEDRVDLLEWLRLHKSVSRLFKQVCKPKNPFLRLFWRFMSNPMLKATPAEVGSAVHFFSIFLRLDSLLNPTTGTPNGILPANWRASLENFQLGAKPVNPKAGNISSSEFAGSNTRKAVAS